MASKRFADFGDELIIEHAGQQLKVVFIKEDSNELVFKLPSGYNIRLRKSAVKIIQDSSTGGKGQFEMQESAKLGSGQRKISLLSTGGTIASRVDYSTGAVKPTKDLGFIRDSVKDISDRMSLSAEIIDSILSENMSPDNWIDIGRKVYRSLEKEDAIVLLHGTDTMSYTASALSFMFKEQKGPIIMTGSQRSSDRPSSDAFENIEAAIRFSLEDIGEVGVCMHSSISDGDSTLIRGVRARKMHTSRRDAFQAIGYGMIGTISGKELSLQNVRKRGDAANIFSDKINTKAGIYYFNPLSDADDLENFSRGKDAVVIMATGLGHVADRLFPKIRELSDSGKHFLITSQCLYGRVDLDVYASGRRLAQAGAIALEDMLPEVALVKSMYVLAHHPEEFARYMLEDLRGEISARSHVWGDSP